MNTVTECNECIALGYIVIKLSWCNKYWDFPIQDNATVLSWWAIFSDGAMHFWIKDWQFTLSKNRASLHKFDKRIHVHSFSRSLFLQMIFFLEKQLQQQQQLHASKGNIIGPGRPYSNECCCFNKSSNQLQLDLLSWLLSQRSQLVTCHAFLIGRLLKRWIDLLTSHLCHGFSSDDMLWHHSEFNGTCYPFLPPKMSWNWPSGAH